MYLYPLYSGSSGNSTLIEHKNTTLLVDAGVSGKSIVSALISCDTRPESLSAILVTHEHTDHIKSVGTLSRKFDIPIFANSATWEAMTGKIGEVSEKNIRVFDTSRDFCIGDINILPFSIPHDAADPVAFSFSAGKARASVATDIGHVTSEIFSILSKNDIILIESNHDIDMLKKGIYPDTLKRRILGDKGHLSNESCATLLTSLYNTGVKRAILGHLSRENNTEELAYTIASRTISNAGIGDYMLNIAHRDRVCGKFEV